MLLSCKLQGLISVFKLHKEMSGMMAHICSLKLMKDTGSCPLTSKKATMCRSTDYKNKRYSLKDDHYHIKFLFTTEETVFVNFQKTIVKHRSELVEVYLQYTSTRIDFIAGDPKPFSALQ